MVADFMHTYSAYTLQACLNEYAITFFALLNEAYKSRARKYQMLMRLICYPYMSNDQERKQFEHHLEWMAKDGDDILNEDATASTPEQIRKVLG